MSTSTKSAQAVSTTSVTAHTILSRIGIALATLLGIADVVLGATQLGPDALFPIELAVGVIVLGVATLVAVPFAWRGATWAVWVIVVTRLLSGLSPIPGFFEAGVPAEAISLAVATILLNLAAVVFVLFRKRSV